MNALVLFGSKINNSLELLQRLGVLLPTLQKKKSIFCVLILTLATFKLYCSLTELMQVQFPI